MTGFPSEKSEINLEQQLVDSLGFFPVSWGGNDTNDLPFTYGFDLPTETSDRVELILKSLQNKPAYWVFDEDSFKVLKKNQKILELGPQVLFLEDSNSQERVDICENFLSKMGEKIGNKYRLVLTGPFGSRGQNPRSFQTDLELYVALQSSNDRCLYQTLHRAGRGGDTCSRFTMNGVKPNDLSS